MATVANLAANYVVSALPGFGFSLDQNESCNHFRTKLTGLVNDFCRFYDGEIEIELGRRPTEKKQIDLVSWAHSEVAGLLYSALGNYRDRVCNHETINLPVQKINCLTALSYFVWFIEELEATKMARSAGALVEPSSRKHQEKRANHAWKPYGVATDFAALKAKHGGK